jgi:DNA-binding beta-propeller fold protein YncE
MRVVNDLLYVSVEEGLANGSGGVIAVDLNTHKVVKSVAGDYRAHWFILTPDGKKAYTIHKTGQFVSVLDMENQKLVKKIDVAGSEEGDISPDGRFAYIPVPSIQFGPSAPGVTKGFAVIDTATDEIMKIVPTEHGIASIHVVPGNKLMVAHYRMAPAPGVAGVANFKPLPGKLSLFDAETYAFLGEADVGVLPLTLRSSLNGKLGFVAAMVSGDVTVVDLSTMEVLKTLEVDKEQRTGEKEGALAHGMVMLP